MGDKEEIYRGMNIKCILGYYEMYKIGDEFVLGGLGTKESYKIQGTVYDGNICRLGRKRFKIILDDTFLQKFKEEKIVINCETGKESEEFLNWCYNKGLRGEVTNKKYNTISNFYVFNYWRTKALSHNSTSDFYKKGGYIIIKYKDLILPEKESKKLDNKFNIGDKVVIVDTGRCYRTYEAMANKLSATKYSEHYSPLDNQSGKIVNFSKHLDDYGLCKDKILYLVDCGIMECLIEEKGLNC